MAALVVAAVSKLWPGFLTNPLHSLPAFKAQVATEVREHAKASGALAQRQYRAQRRAAGETDTFRPTIATLPSVDEIAAMVDEALAGLDLDDPVAVAGAQETLGRSAEDVVFDTGVRTILGNADKDRKARGYARIPEPEACAFCLMLATRGAVYKADRSRGRGNSFAASNAKFTDGPLPSSIKVHDSCRCHPEPVFGIYEAPARVREAEALWIEVGRRKDARGRTNHTLRFRQAVEGRLPPLD